MTPDLAGVISEVLDEIDGLSELGRAELIRRLLEQLPMLLELYAKQRGLQLVAAHVTIVDERHEA